MRAAFLSVHVRSSVLARAPSRLVSTEALVGTKSQLAGSVDAMMPFATFIGLVTAVGGIGTLFLSRMTKLEAEMAGTAATLEAKMAGTAAALKSDMAGTAATLKSDMAGLKETITKEVDAKNAGLKETITKEVDAKNAGSEKAIDAKIAGSEKAADLKVRVRPVSTRPTADSPPLLTRSSRPSDVAAAAVVFGRCISGIGRCAAS